MTTTRHPSAPAAWAPRDAGGSAEQIHAASLDLLADPGVRMEHAGVVARLLKAGARPGHGADVVRLPREMVDEYVRRCPRTVTLTDRSGRAAVLADRAWPAIWSCPGLNLWDDGAVRPFTASDMARAARLLDRLDNVQGVFGMAMADVSPAAADVAGLAIIARNTAKHVRVFCFTPEGGRTLTEMKAVVGHHPWFSMGFTAHGPLRWTNLALSIFEATSGHGIPVTVNGEPMAGTSAPVTLAGAAAVGNAEILAGLVALQLMEPGRPCIYNLGLAHIFDMRTMIAVTGGPENALLATLSAEMGRFYGLPAASWVSTEAMVPDAQAALEKMFGFHTHMAAGIANIWGVGQLESELTFSPAQAVIDDEMIAYAARFQRGIAVNETTLATELVRAVGIGGQFLDQEHTLQHFREELFMPALLGRRKRDAWQAQGGKRLDEVATDRARELMQAAPRSGLTDDQMATLDQLAATRGWNMDR
ncbi:MAG: trimethylamine methyltransferase family protein [Lentisphaerae bacterium]|nr:trimethylamine methyltransferase family protein [Lentisphaerota bacterium]